MDEALRARLLELGGHAVEGPLPAPDELEGAQAFPRLGVVEMGKPDLHRHRNVARMWRDLKGWGSPDLHLCTGLALSEGVWRRHSWCVYYALGEPVVLEPSTAKDRYFGAVLDGSRADCFVLEHK